MVSASEDLVLGSLVGTTLPEMSRTARRQRRLPKVRATHVRHGRS